MTDLPRLFDDALALKFAERYAGRIQYVPIARKWILRRSDQWQVYDSLEVLELARGFCREAARDVPDLRAAQAVASARTARRVLRLVRAKERAIVRGEIADKAERRQAALAVYERIVGADPSLSKASRIALVALRGATAETGEVLLGSKIPANVKAVSVWRWRSRCYDYISRSSAHAAKQIAFRRARSRLIEAGLICVEGEHVWICS